MARTNAKEPLIRAARDLFSVKGYDGTSVDEIAESIGIKGPTIYKYFKNKEDLLKAVVDTAEDEYIKGMGISKELPDRIGSGAELKAYSLKSLQFTLKNDTGSACSKIIDCSIQKSLKKFNADWVKIMSGEVSLPSYKKDQPIPIGGCHIRLEYTGGVYIMTVPVFNQKYQKENGYSRIRFRVNVRDDSQESIINRVIIGEYKLAESTISYRNKKWFLSLSYSFEHKINNGLDKEKILGVDLGCVNALYAGSSENFDRHVEEGGDIEAYISKIEARTKSMQKQAAKCGGGRIGHGTSTRIRSVYKLKNKASNYRDTKNHIMSRHLIDFAIKNGYGTIQMEDLSGIKSETGNSKFLRHWAYYDLQTKIQNKAKEAGIEFVKINPRYTSQRCSKCGHIDKDNRPSQAIFKCTRCGFEINADWNAARNISIKDIDLIISNTINA